MPVALTASAKGANDFQRVSRQLKQMGTDGKGLRKELYKGIGRAAKPLTLAVRLATPKYLPDTYAVVLAKSLRVATRKRTGTDPGIKLAATAKGKTRTRRLLELERGQLMHPLFGNRDFWYTQQVHRGWWTEPLDAGAPKVRKEMIQVINDMDRKLSRG